MSAGTCTCHYRTPDKCGHEPHRTPRTWQVHVIGPDDYLPAKDQLDAILQANAINAEVARCADEADPYAPFVWATPERIDQ